MHSASEIFRRLIETVDGVGAELLETYAKHWESEADRRAYRMLLESIGSGFRSRVGDGFSRALHRGAQGGFEANDRRGDRPSWVDTSACRTKALEQVDKPQPRRFGIPAPC